MWWPLSAHIIKKHMTCFNQQRWKKTPSGYQVPFLSMKGNKGTWWSPFQKKSMIRKKKKALGGHQLSLSLMTRRKMCPSFR
jgi:hypothetical protein